jgi:predicted glycoside hydrolase/deacetylase ChbG (UPF0249 family)
MNPTGGTPMLTKITILISALSLFWLSITFALNAKNMAERLGYPATARLLIINADDFGMCHAENMATMNLLTDKIISSATVMIPCPWVKEAAEFFKKNPQVAVGIHLTLTNEWEHYNWGPVTSLNEVRSLVTTENYLHRESKAVEMNARPEEVRLELKNQIERALQLGFVPSHLDNHMGSVYGLEAGRDFLNIVFDLCTEYQLPFRLPANLPRDLQQMLPPEAAQYFQKNTQTALERGICIIDFLESTEMQSDYETFRDGVIAQLKALKPGLTELYIHPALPTDELKAITNAWRHRDFEERVFRDPLVRKAIQQEKIKIISWLDLRDFQRQQPAAPKK